MPMQPNLFYELETETFDEKAKMDAGKNVVRRLLSVRQELQAEDNHSYIHLLNDAINAVRAESSYSAAQSERLILNSIEKSQANTFEEIADDTRLSVEIVKRIVRRLESENVLGIIPRSKRSGTELIYSKRKSDVEVT